MCKLIFASFMAILLMGCASAPTKQALSCDDKYGKTYTQLDDTGLLHARVVQSEKCTFIEIANKGNGNMTVEVFYENQTKTVKLPAYKKYNDVFIKGDKPYAEWAVWYGDTKLKFKGLYGRYAQFCNPSKKYEAQMQIEMHDAVFIPVGECSEWVEYPYNSTYKVSYLK